MVLVSCLCLPVSGILVSTLQAFQQTLSCTLIPVVDFLEDCSMLMLGSVLISEARANYRILSTHRRYYGTVRESRV